MIKLIVLKIVLNDLEKILNIIKNSKIKLLNSIFGEKAKEVRDSSLKLPHGSQGVVINIQRLKRSEGDELQPGVDDEVGRYLLDVAAFGLAER